MRAFVLLSPLLFVSCTATTRTAVQNPPSCGAVDKAECSEAAREVGLWADRLCDRAAGEATVYRFEWARTFHNPVVIELRQDGDGYLLSAQRYDGAGGYDWGEVDVDTTVALSAEQWERQEALLDSTAFWSQPSLSFDEFYSLPDNYMAFDGAQWTASGVRGGQYQSMACPNPLYEAERSAASGFVGRWGLYLLELSGMLPEVPDEIY